MTLQFMGTFGVRYKSEKHPSGLKVDPDGYVLIHADDMDHAIRLMQRKYGTAYGFVYSKESFGEANYGRTGYDHHPVGVIDTLGVES